MNQQTETLHDRERYDTARPDWVTPAEDFRTIAINQISWGAIFAGVAVGLIAQLLLNMVGLGIGLATLDPGMSDNPSAGGFSIGAAVWWVLSGVIAAFLGGWIAGRLAGKPRDSTGGWHGITTWAVTSLAVIYLLTTAFGNIVGGSLSALGSVANGVGRTASTVATVAAPAAQGQGGNIADTVKSSVDQATGGVNIADTAKAVIGGATNNDPAKQAQGNEQAAQAYAQAKGVPIEQARGQVAQSEDQARMRAAEMKQQALQAANNAAHAASIAALVAAVSLLLGAVAGWLGGRRGAVHPIGRSV